MENTEKTLKSLQKYTGKTVFVGMSGGVDSAVSCALLQKAGANVKGVYMKNWAGEEGLQLDCPWMEEMESAQAVCDHLGVEFFSYNFEKEYKKHVLDYFFYEYKNGRTPNPDILCNSQIKFKAFLNRSVSEGADFIATGHYAGVRELAGRYELINAVDATKDQTYFLSDLNQEQLAHAIFPLQYLTKKEVRQIAIEFGLPNANKKDSQGICFIGDLDVAKFLRKYISDEPGNVVDFDTRAVVGKHDGVAYYTIGQREGLGIGGTKEPYYVAAKDSKKKIIYVAQGRDNPSLYESEIVFADMHWIDPAWNKKTASELNSSTITAAIRYRQKPEQGEFKTFSNQDLAGIFRFKEPQWAVSPGQSIVFYSGDTCLGRAIIANL